MGLLDFFRRTPARDAFADSLLQQIRQRKLAADCHYDSTKFRIVSGSDGDHVFSLENVYRDYCAASHTLREQIVQNCLAAYSQPGMPPVFADVQASLMPLIRSRRLSDHQRLLGLYEPERAPLVDVWQALGDDAIILLAYDTESSIRTVTQAMLAQWGVTFEVALEFAMGNLRDRTPQQLLAVGDGVLMGEWQDSYDSSRLLLPDFLYRACQGGEPLVMIPTRGRFLLTSSNNVAGQLKMIALADKLLQDEGRYVSSVMYGVQDGKITTCQPSDAAVLAALRRFQTTIRAHHYKEQKEEWDRLHDRTGEDIFVASYLLLQNQENGPVTPVTTWAYRVDSLLPRTDVVVMQVPDAAGGKSTTKMLAWNDVLAIAGHLMEEVDCYPVRYRVREFPELQRLEAAPARQL